MSHTSSQAGKGAELIASLACFSSILESYGYPKPGNVHRFADAEDTTLLHFLASSVAIFSPLIRAGKVGRRIGKAEIPPSNAEIGLRTLECVKSTREWGIRQNTNLGIILLLVPLVIAAGATLGEIHDPSKKDLRSWLKYILENSAPSDAIYVGQAIALVNPSGLGTVSKFDVRLKEFESEIKANKATLIELFAPARKNDLIASEYFTNFQITFEDSVPFITKLEKAFCLEERNVMLFLHLLSTYTDSHVARNKGEASAKAIRQEIKDLGTPESLLANPDLLWKFDQRLRHRKINPGTIADLTAAGLFVSMLNRFQKPDFEGLDFCQPLMTTYFSEK
ncbi:MAG: triphosphoribosyl-dephospho-CoA synthase [Candidatus Hodarchaeales archaeon]|jgi:triphosphoribosyl-dephospho-CoA synthase